jgi:hypothetical protein
MIFASFGARSLVISRGPGFSDAVCGAQSFNGEAFSLALARERACPFSPIAIFFPATIPQPDAFLLRKLSLAGS